MCSSYILIPYEDQWPTALRVVLYLSGLVYSFLGLAVITQRFMVAMDNVVSQTKEVKIWDEQRGNFVHRTKRVWNQTIADISLLALGTSAAQISLSVITAVQQLGSINSNQASGVATIAGGAASNLFPTLAWCTLVPLKGQVKKIEQFEVFLVETFWALWAYVWLYIVVEVWTPGAITVLEACLTVAQFPLLIAHAYAQDRRIPYLSFNMSKEEKVQPAPPERLGGLQAKNSRSALLDGIRTSLDPQVDGEIFSGESTGTVPQVDSDPSPSAQTRGPFQALQVATLNGQTWMHPEVFVSVDGFRRRSTGTHDKENMEAASPNDNIPADANTSKVSESAEVSSGRASSNLPESSMPQGTNMGPSCFDPNEILQVQEESIQEAKQEGRTSAVTMQPFFMRWGKQILEALVVSHALRQHSGSELEHPQMEALSFEKSGARKRRLEIVMRVFLDALCLFWRVLFAVLVPPADACHGWLAFIASIVIIAGMCSFVVELSTLFSCASGVDSFIVAITLLATGSSIPNIISSGIAASQSKSADSAIANVNASNAMNVFLGLGLPWIITSAYGIITSHTDYPISTEGLGSSLIVFFVTVALAYTVLIGRRYFNHDELGGGYKLLIAAAYILLWTCYIVFALLAFFHLI